jgi:hypothetical protein
LCQLELQGSGRWGQVTPADQLDEGLQVGRQRAVGLGERDELPDHPEGAAGAQAELTGRSQVLASDGLTMPGGRDDLRNSQVTSVEHDRH